VVRVSYRTFRGTSTLFCQLCLLRFFAVDFSSRGASRKRAFKIRRYTVRTRCKITGACNLTSIESTVACVYVLRHRVEVATAQRPQTFVELAPRRCFGRPLVSEALTNMWLVVRHWPRGCWSRHFTVSLHFEPLFHGNNAAANCYAVYASTGVTVVKTGPWLFLRAIACNVSRVLTITETSVCTSVCPFATPLSPIKRKRCTLKGRNPHWAALRTLVSCDKISCC